MFGRIVSVRAQRELKDSPHGHYEHSTSCEETQRKCHHFGQKRLPNQLDPIPFDQIHQEFKDSKAGFPGPFGLKSIQSHISTALFNGMRPVGAGGDDCGSGADLAFWQKWGEGGGGRGERGKMYSWRTMGRFSKIGCGAVPFWAVDAKDRVVEIEGAHKLFTGATIEPRIQCNSFHLREAQLRVVIHQVLSTGPSPASRWRMGERTEAESNAARKFQAGWSCPSTITVAAISDFRQRSLVSLEALVGDRKEGTSVAALVSSNLSKIVSKGLATTHRLTRQVSLYTRCSSEGLASSKRFLLQAVRQSKSKCFSFSPVVSVLEGRPPQGGFTLKYASLVPLEITKQMFVIKAFANTKGALSILVRARLGEVDNEEASDEL